jgi:D-alanyl-D-alanine carboxypeptidase
MHTSRAYRRPFTIRALAAVSALLAVVVPSAPSAAGASGRDDRGLQAALDGLVAAGAPGAVLYDRHGNHTVTLAGGYADVVQGRSMRVDDRFRAGSQMKSFTAAIVLQLVDEGRLGLDDPVDDLLPGVIPHGYGAGVTVRHLLQHSSGLFNFDNDPRVLAPYFAGDMTHQWTPQQLLDMAFEHEPVFPPGTGFQYSDTAYILAAYVVEAVTGNTFDHELRHRLLRPLGLRDTSLPTDSAIAGRYAHGYIEFGDPPASTDITGIQPFSWAGGGVVSTVEDSSKFFRALMGGRLLSRPLMREMMKTIEVTDSDLPSRSGLGVYRWTPCGVAWGKSGNSPGYLVYTWISPDTRHETTLMINEDPRSVGAPAYAAYIELLNRSFCDR